MNRWECEHPGCNSRADGVGGAVGLRAVGWFVEVGRNFRLLCPWHWPEDMKKLQPYDVQAHTLQRLMREP